MREDGYWRKKKKRDKHGTNADWGDGLGERRVSKDAASSDALHSSMHSEHSGNAEIGVDQHVPDIVEEMKRKTSPDGSNVPSLSHDHTGAEEEEAKSTTSDEDRRTMSMFNVVFVVHPPLLEHNLRIKEMFEYVVKKFAKALKYEQARSNWVWRQSEVILNMKERARDQSGCFSLPLATTGYDVQAWFVAESSTWSPLIFLARHLNGNTLASNPLKVRSRKGTVRGLLVDIKVQDRACFHKRSL